MDLSLSIKRSPPRVCKIYSLAIAREKAFEARRKVKEGIDPIEECIPTLHDDRITIDFCEASGRYIAAKSPEWKNAKHKQQWTNTIAKYCTPIIGPISVNATNTEYVLRCLEPIGEKNQKQQLALGVI